ncbi:cell division protein ZapE [Gynuella sp.]|uniref:cell division protein ZapE n=1 Tax=Gynuella sp. TaxID=2969146 RepID=UPI003D13E27D
MPLIRRYREELNLRGYQEDPYQLEALSMLDTLGIQLQQFQQSNANPFKRLFKRPDLPQSVYFWGGVGRGKTFLMDLFFETLDVNGKQRMHFHRFMQMIHQRLAELKHEKNPIDQIIGRFAEEVQILCLDEFFVSDIGDAMILANVLNACYENRIVIVTTSNIYPEGLYANGLQRDRFVPAIKGILEHFQVYNLDAGTDYRLRALTQATLYFSPLENTGEHLAKLFDTLISDAHLVQEQEVVEILGRPIQSVRVCNGVLWIDFSELCEGPRSQNDYIELGKLFHTVMLDHVHLMTTSTEDTARRFINLVDEFYDRGVKLIIRAQISMEALYQGKRLAFEFQRTLSRLIEMQSEEYLALPHRLD